MSTMVSQITGVRFVYSTPCSGANQRKHQSCVSLAFVMGIHRRPMNSPHTGPVTRKMFPFDDVIVGGDKYFLDNTIECQEICAEFCCVWVKYRLVYPHFGCYNDILLFHQWQQICRLDMAGSSFVPRQRETTSLCNDVSHWLGASLELALVFYRIDMETLQHFWLFARGHCGPIDSPHKQGP